ncbi:FUSC family protein [Photobacterium sp. ZSDE20]|uniref:FUSC family protein n=1 Tax=Photobacterium pectinilyticum TaxID=2906793 RepID=A0ABT1MZW2_9GAMM|nr:FUSC family protein [Photobacterium sp. ZSDE20]MCQ1058038.1 FUSC family protein [Photobacterium sp. ZSDE20]MDD1822571.1 FUSC family protein [Photobacterium sp. ZSDE20]
MLNQRCILPLKVAIALTLAIVSALWLGWDRPYWAGFAVVVMAATETSGHSLKKGRHRLVGTLLGVVAALMLVGVFTQQPLPLLLCYSLFAALCVYLQGNPKNGYIWTICLAVCSLVIVMGQLLPELTFSMAVLRVQETVLGILSFTLVFSLLWPSSSRSVVISTLRLYFENQDKQLQVANGELFEHGTFTKELNLGDSLRQLTRLEDLIYAASADSYHVAQDYPQWQTLLDQLNQWALLCGHLAELSEQSKGELEPEQCAEIASLLERLSLRVNNALGMLEASSPTEQESVLVTPKKVSLITPRQSGMTVKGTHDLHGTTLMLGSLLTQIDQLHYDIVATLGAVTGTGYANAEEAGQTKSKQAKPAKAPYQTVWAFRPDSAIAALKVFLVNWICIALWIYVPMPGGAMIVMLGALLSSIVLSLPFANVKNLLFSMFAWSLFVLAQYVLLMPMMTEVWQLAAFYFINAFGIWYVLNQPQQVLQRLIGTQLLIMMTSGAMQLTPVYDIQQALLQLLLLAIVMLVVFWVNHTVFSGTPESTFLREMQRLRMGLRSNLQPLSHKPYKRFQFLQDPLRSVAMAERAMGRINWAKYPDLESAKVNALITSAYKACLLLRAFEDSYQNWLQSSHQQALEMYISKILKSLATILEEPTTSEALTAHQQQLDNVLGELQHYLIGLDNESVLQFSHSKDDIDASYRLLTSLKLLIVSLNSLSLNVHNSEIHHLRLQPFAI